MRVPTVVRRGIYVLTPDILRLGISTGPLSERTKSETAWLTGLRAVAAIVVFNWHYASPLTQHVAFGYGFDSAHKTLLELPFVRILWSGIAMVSVFFIVAGYTIALRPLSLMQEAYANRSNDITKSSAEERLLESLASSTFRRFFRLYLPCAVVMLATAMVARIGIFSPADEHIKLKGPWNTGKPERFIVYAPSLVQQLSTTSHDLLRMMNVWELGDYWPIDIHLWTIRFEMRASLCLYLLLLVTSKCKAVARLVILMVISLLLLLCDRWPESLYVWGACVAQVSIMMPSSTKGAINSDSRDSSAGSAHAVFASLKRLVMHTSFLTSVFLLSIPHKGWDRAPSYAALVQYSEYIMGSRRDKWITNPGALLLLTTMQISGPKSIYKRVLNHPILQYIGRISFAFYILHGPVLHAFGYMMPIMIWKGLGYSEQPDVTLLAAIPMCIGWVSSLLVTICLADTFTREVERRLVALTARLEKSCR